MIALRGHRSVPGLGLDQRVAAAERLDGPRAKLSRPSPFWTNLLPLVLGNWPLVGYSDRLALATERPGQG
jgi:hypothetical protein